MKHILISILIFLALLFPQNLPEPVPPVTTISTSELNKQILCLIEVAWFEARNQGTEGIDAVYSVVINRMNSGKYPKSFCGVVNQPYQFSFRNKVHPSKPIKIKPTTSELEILKSIESKAFQISTGSFTKTLPDNVLFYHTKDLNPNWGKKLKKYTTINHHVFYSLDFPRSS